MKLHISKGFTIIELLVVIVLIGILSSIAVLSYSSITKRAYNTAVDSAMIQAKKAVMLYAIDNDVNQHASNIQSGTITMRNILINGGYLKSTFDDGLKKYGPSNTLLSQPVFISYCGNGMYYIFAAAWEGTAASQVSTDYVACGRQLATTLGVSFGGGFSYSVGTYYKSLTFTAL